MDWDENTEPAEEKFIPGIYNYCDRWCERCLYTDRCRTVAMEKVLVKKVEEEERRKKSMEENKKFWNQIDKAVSEAAETYDEFILSEKKDSLSELKFLFDDEEEEDAAEAMKDFKETVKKVENHLLSKVAFQYENAVRKWFGERKKILQIIYERDSEKTMVKYPGIDDKLILKQLSDTVNVIHWYQIQVGIKIQRALTSIYEEETDDDFFEGIPKDSDGSAMVALKGIERSLGAWNLLYKILDSENESIAPFITLLFLLRAELVKLFPGATTFQWPPES